MHCAVVRFLLRAALVAGVALHPAVAMAAAARLTNGSGDGTVAIDVDPYGAFGFHTTGTTAYDPAGDAVAAETVYESGVVLGSLGDVLRSGSPGVPAVDFTEVTDTVATSSFTVDGLQVALAQRLGPSDGGGSVLTQTYRFTNLGTASRTVVLVRYLDGDLDFDGSEQDAGGAAADGRVLFEFEANPEERDSTFVGVSSLGGRYVAFAVHPYESQGGPIALFLQEIRAAGGIPAAAANVVFGDGDGDRLVDAPYDITLSLQNDLDLAPGATATFVTLTIFGAGRPEEATNCDDGLDNDDDGLVDCDDADCGINPVCCGNGRTDPGEECDAGSTRGTCCTSTCSLAAKGTECRALAGACDLAEQCDGASAQCPADRVQPGTATCRPAAGACDVAERCDGTSTACPADVVLDARVTCRSPAGACDVAEQCDGRSAACPADGRRPPGFVCRASAAACDVAEVCDGTTTACPVDAIELDGASCDSGDNCRDGDACFAGACEEGAQCGAIAGVNADPVVVKGGGAAVVEVTLADTTGEGTPKVEAGGFVDLSAQRTPMGRAVTGVPEAGQAVTRSVTKVLKARRRFRTVVKLRLNRAGRKLLQASSSGTLPVVLVVKLTDRRGVTTTLLPRRVFQRG